MRMSGTRPMARARWARKKVSVTKWKDDGISAVEAAVLSDCAAAVRRHRKTRVWD